MRCGRFHPVWAVRVLAAKIDAVNERIFTDSGVRESDASQSDPTGVDTIRADSARPGSGDERTTHDRSGPLCRS